MIWFFVMGMVAGAVGWNMFIVWYGRKLKRKQQMKAFRRNDHD